MKRKLPLLLFCALLFSACVRNPVTGKRQFAVMSEKNEIAMGQAYDPQIVAQFGVYQDPTIQTYFDAMGQEMAKISHRPKLKYEFKIMDSPVVNAFAVPGGFVYFTRGIMAHFNNEAEFAGVLGHEIGHITARHSVVQQRNATLAQIGLIAGIIVSPEFAQFAQPASQGVQLMLLKFGRDAESQSDELGVEYSSKINYDAHEMAQFFNTLARKSEEAGAGDIPEFLSTHPNPLNRLEAVDELAGEWQTKLKLQNPKVGRDSYLTMLEGLVYGEDPRQGFVENWNFYHPELKFEFPVPNGWQHQNSPQQFQMAPADGKALMFLTLAQGTDPREAGNTVIQKYGLELLASNEETNNGLNALILTAQQKPVETQQGQTQQQQQILKAQITLIKYGELIYEITGVAAKEDFNSYLPTFGTTMRGFKQLTNADKLNRQPERIHVQRTNQSKSLEQQLTGAGIPQPRLEEFAIVNGMELTDQVPTGTLIKVLK